jgi:hypothetical protein
MATNDDTKKPADDLADLLTAYRALEDLSHSHQGADHPVYVMLEFLNVEFARRIDEFDARGLLS